MNNVGGSPFYRPDNGAKAPCLTGRQEVHNRPGARCVTGPCSPYALFCL
ncbi:hypothetical protein LTSEMIS_3673, partial [Salmonella enterica subsp. enterica serovar Mississippi str. A4-633]